MIQNRKLELEQYVKYCKLIKMLEIATHKFDIERARISYVYKTNCGRARKMYYNSAMNSFFFLPSEQYINLMLDKDIFCAATCYILLDNQFKIKEYFDKNFTFITLDFIVDELKKYSIFLFDEDREIEHNDYLKEMNLTQEFFDE